MSAFTKQAIKDTFMRLLEERPLREITVKMIASECGINRNTFYYHYQDLPELVEEILFDEADRIKREHPTTSSVQEALDTAIAFASQHRKAILHIYDSVNRDIFERYLWKVCNQGLDDYIHSAADFREVSSSDAELVGAFYKYACFGMIMAWLGSHMASDIHAQVDRFYFLHRGMADEMLRRARENPVV